MRTREDFFRLDFILPEYMQILPHVFDRCNASHYFIVNSDDKGEAIAIWYARAAINEFKSALELIPVDLRLLSLANEWKNSTNKKRIEENLIIKMINNSRNLSFHAATIDHLIKERPVRIVGPDESHISNFKTLFIDGFQKQEKNIRLHLNREEIKKITEIEDGIPLFMILSECYSIASINLENFLIDNGRISIEESQQFWNKYP